MATVIERGITLSKVIEMAQADYGFMIKGCVDIVGERVALGGEYHIESCELLQKTFQSKTSDVWGFNVVFTDAGYELEYDSLVNIKPELNRSRVIGDEKVKESVRSIVAAHIV